MDARSSHPSPADGRQAPARVARIGLGGRIGLLVTAFVMLSEIAIYVPSIANFRNNWLRDRLSAADTAANSSGPRSGSFETRTNRVWVSDGHAGKQARTHVYKK